MAAMYAVGMTDKASRSLLMMAHFCSTLDSSALARIMCTVCRVTVRLATASSA